MQLRPKQIEDLAALIQNPRYGLFHDPAVGKTPPVCVWMWWIWDELNQKTIWVMPKSLLRKNRKELLDWSKFSEADVQIIEEPPAQVRALRLMKANIRFETIPDKNMIDVLRGDRTKRSALKRAIKLGYVVDDQLTEAGAAALEKGPTKDVYLDGKREVGRVFIEELIEKGIFTKKCELTDVGRTILERDLFRDSLHYDAKVLLMGFDFFADNWDWLLHYNPEIRAVSVDEIHMGFGDHKSQRTQQFYRAMNRVERFVPMTGTLVNGRLNSAYPTIHALGPCYYASYGDFMGQHAVTDFWGSVIGWQNHEKLGEVLKRVGRRRTFEEEYGPEAKVIIKEVVPMSPEQRAKYDEFHEKAMLELEDKFLDGTLPGVHVIRARQIMQCPEIFGLCKGETTGKDERLKVYLSNEGKQFVIFAVFQPEQERLVELVEGMGLSVELINAHVSAAKRSRIDQAFQKGELQGIVASGATAGVGFNWGNADWMAFSSLDYQDGNFMQAYRRAIRGKRDKALPIYVLEYERSVDQRIFQIVDYKAQNAQMVDPTRQVWGLSQHKQVENVV